MDIITTAGEEFTRKDSAAMALMVYRRFGYNIEASVEAWNRLHQNNTTSEQFMELVVEAALNKRWW